MKKTLIYLILILFYFSRCATGNDSTSASIGKKRLKTSDSITGQISPLVRNIFYDLPLEKSRREIYQIIKNDRRFVSTISSFNNYEPSSFFKGITSDKGLIKSNPDSIQVMFFLGNTSLSTEKDGEANFKDIMLLRFNYFYSSIDNVEIEYKSILNMLHPILNDSNSEKSESPFSNGEVRGQMTVISEIFQNYNPYYRVGISSISMFPSDNSKSVYALEIVFSKEDK